MGVDEAKSKQSTDLRSHAEEMLQGKTEHLKELSAQDIESLIHELRVHQIELEMQNEELRRAQKELEESRNKYTDLYDSAPISYFTFDTNGLIMEVNLTGARMLGMERSYLIRVLFSLFVAPSNRNTYYSHLRQVFKTRTKQACELKIMNKKKNPFDARLESIVVQDSEGNYNHCRTAVIDITEHKHAEEALHKAYDELELRVKERTAELAHANETLKAEIQERKRIELNIQEARTYAESIVETVREPLLVLDEQMRVKTANVSFYRTFKVSPEETLNKIIYDLGDRQWNIPRLRELLEEIIPKNNQFQDFEVDHEFPNIGRKIMLLNARQIYNKDIGAQMILLAIEDVTEHKRMEEERKKWTAELARSNAELEQFAYMASHDLQEPLRMVSGFTQLLARRYKGKLDKDADEFIAYVVDGITRMQRMIDDLLTYSRVGTRGKSFEPTNLEDVLNQAVTNLKTIIEENKAQVIHDPLPTVMADATQIIQLFQNLIANAIKFKKKEEPPRIHIGAQRKGNEWVFSVKDNGVGIAPEFMGHLFQLFQREHTAGEYPGTGIGLAICKRIVERHSGRIWAESKPERGSTFYFTIPARRDRG